MDISFPLAVRLTLTHTLSLPLVSLSHEPLLRQIFIITRFNRWAVLSPWAPWKQNVHIHIHTHMYPYPTRSLVSTVGLTSNQVSLISQSSLSSVHVPLRGPASQWRPPALVRRPASRVFFSPSSISTLCARLPLLYCVWLCRDIPPPSSRPAKNIGTRAC